MKTKENKIWDVVVIGGGPAGMMAAGRAAELGCSVLLLEKNLTLGKKLLITGGGRCNVTNNQPNVRAMLAKYKGNHKFLFSAFSQFGVDDTLEFFNRRGMATKEEAEGRIFPVSNRAQSVLDTLVNYMKESGVEIQTNSAVVGFSFVKAKRRVSMDGTRRDSVESNFCIRLENKEQIIARACIIATGGTARPETGSTGEGFGWLKKIGHTIVENNSALVPVALQDAWVKKIGGVTLKDIKLTTWQNGQKQDVQQGKLLFTHFGISGPTVLNMSKDIGDLLEQGEVVIKLDLFPQLDHEALKQELQTLLVAESNKKLKNTLSNLIPAALVTALLELAGINGETANHSVRHEERVKLVALIKNIPLNVKGLLGKDKAIVSSGGVDPKEVDFKTMQSRLVPGLYIIGDALNIDRPSGGYSLQLCWTTGFVAGSNV